MEVTAHLPLLIPIPALSHPATTIPLFIPMATGHPLALGLIVEMATNLGPLRVDVVTKRFEVAALLVLTGVSNIPLVSGPTATTKPYSRKPPQTPQYLPLSSVNHHPSKPPSPANSAHKHPKKNFKTTQKMLRLNKLHRVVVQPTYTQHPKLHTTAWLQKSGKVADPMSMFP